MKPQKNKRNWPGNLLRALFSRAALIILLILTAFSAFGQMAQGKAKWLGNIWYNSSEPLKFSEYWNQATAENGGKWESVEAQRDRMNWSTIDAMYKWCKNKGFPYTQHVLVWGSAGLGWLNNLPASEQKEEVEEWIRLYGERYPDTDYIVVVNEMFHAPPFYKNAIGGNGETGWDWVVWAFEKARQYCPQSQLLINEYNVIEGWTPVLEYVKLINLLKSRKLIDGVGIQNHGLENINVDAIISRTNELATAGVPLFVTELDIAMRSETEQKDKYAELFPIFYEHPAVAGITLWGYLEGHHWRNNAHIMNVDGTERPALTWIREYMASQPDVVPTPVPVCVLKGDGNGDNQVNIVDALLAARFYVDPGVDIPLPLCLDVDCSSAVNIIDALLIARKYVGFFADFDC
ncbi:MAG: endo-1,4-beta-xylanase [Spirochaetales bacterium]|nr:endo-1,4-beta-xylanase [Spirochaetales bacterium]